MHIKKSVLAGTICSLLATSIQAATELETLIEILRTNGSIDEDQYGRLKKEIKINNARTASEKNVMKTQLDKSTSVTVTINKGGISAKNRDGSFNIKIGGRVQIDAASYDTETGSTTNYGNGTEIRRARLYVQGKMYNDWRYKLQYDFTSTGKAGIKDAYVSYRGLGDISIKLGNFKDPFMLQEQTSSKYITFTERALPDAFSAGRHIGIMTSTTHKYWTAAFGLFGDTVNTKATSENEGWGVGGRLTHAPVNKKTSIIHFGAAANYRTSSAGSTVRFKQQAETHIAGVNIVDTGEISLVDDYLKLGLEFAAVAGPFSTQAEYLTVSVSRAGENLNFDGWYAEAAYFLTGESRNYKAGKFGSIKPKMIVGREGIGAWQIAARYSTINLNDADINGGEADIMALGINWFPAPTLRFSANYVKVLNVQGGAQNNQEPNLVQVRAQWAF
ncbi:MAG: porin [Gammaproteobacteria bacterium]|nr:porin [Gammaproteobacteria bacterium]